jgi:hypothetical protein
MRRYIDSMSFTSELSVRLETETNNEDVISGSGSESVNLGLMWTRV